MHEKSSPLSWRRSLGSPSCWDMGFRSRWLSRSAVLLMIVATFGGIVAASVAATREEVGTDNVLVFYSNGRLFPANVEGDRGLHRAVLADASRPVALFYEFLDAPRFGGLSFEDIFAIYLREKYAARPPRVIVAVSHEALSFLLRHRDALYPRVPIIHAGIDRSYVRSLFPLPADVIGVPADYSFTRTIETALRWHPRAQRLVVVSGASAQDRVLEAQARNECAAFRDRVRIEFLAGLPTTEVLRRLSELGPDAIVFTPGILTDGEGRDWIPAQSAEAMAAVSGAPVYGPYSTWIGTGVVGGFMPSFEAMGRQSGEIVNALLAGADPASLQLPEVVPQALHVDWRQVRRWGIDENAIPGDAVVHFKPPTLLEAHRNGVVLATVVVVLQAALIVGLLVERRRRRSAEEAEQIQRQELARASRFAMAGELTGAIAHEINQPLGAILSNTDAAELILGSGDERHDELRGILADIRRDDLRASEVVRRLRSLLARHEIELQPFDLGAAARDVEPMLLTEARRRGIALHIHTDPDPLAVVGDRVQMQQVLINLTLNAMDAVADLSGHRCIVDVRIGRTDNGLAIVVRDRGHGISPEHLPKLFESFFSTKSGGMGLGLSISRTLVEAHGGRILVESNTTEGTAFRVELPAPGGVNAGHTERT